MRKLPGQGPKDPKVPIAATEEASLLSRLPAPPVVSASDAIPTRIAHFAVLERLGAGGMGVVYRARDERLGRTVAIKLVRASAQARDDLAQSRLEEEARALARLAHPNVVAVYEVGALPDGQVYIVMEHIRGVTLRDWQKRGPVSHERTLAMYRAIADGLIAAHAAGVLHRDFKPENVLLGGDGRPRIIDFGLARALPVPLSGDAAGADLPTLAASTLAGTPGYMAPEQVRGGPLDARTDQFSFCVALYEALTGHPPYGTRAFLLPDPPQRCPRPEPPLPGWLWRVLERGLSPRPADRYPSMAALVAELGRDRLRHRRALGILSLGAMVAVLAGVGARRATPPPCAPATTELAGLWDAGQRQRLQRALSGSPFPFVRALAQGVPAALDRYAADWLHAQQAACEATVVRRSQSAELLERRLSCLAGRRRALAAVVEAFIAAPEQAAAQSDALLQGLPELPLCADPNHLRSGLPPPPRAAAVAQVASLSQALRSAGARLVVGDLAGAEALLARVVPQVAETGHDPLRAEALRYQGELLLRRSQSAAGVAALRQALALATQSRDDELVLDLWILLARDAGPEHQPRSEAEEWLRQSDAWVQRLSGPRDPRRVDVERARGNLAIAAGRNAEAVAIFTGALARMAGNPAAAAQRAIVLRRRATANAQLGKVGTAEGDYRAALADVIGRFGERHPQVVMTRLALGVLLVERGADEAQRGAGRAELMQALRAAQEIFGPTAEEVGHCEQALAQADSLRGDYAGAAGHAAAAAAVFRARLGAAHRRHGEALGALAVARHFQRDYAGALAAYQEALAILEASLGTEHQDVGLMHSNLGETLLALGESAGAVEHFERALRALRRALGPADSNLALPYKGLGLAHLAQRRFVQARVALEAALRLQGAPVGGDRGEPPGGAVVDAQEVAEARWALARALAGQGVDPAQRRALAQQALAGYRGLGPSWAERVREIQRWLAACCKGL